jgi:LmbE family N-acetylglucosaminyl deacetylase
MGRGEAGLMGTLVTFHAHPDDEAIATGGSMARAHAEGHRVVLVVATGGELGEVPDDLAPDETLADRRRAETMASAEALGIDRVVFLGYRDSGMNGWTDNEHDDCFVRAETDEAAERLATVLRDESADVLTIYDWHGNYGHPDHVKVYEVGCRAEQLVAADLPGLRVFEATMNRDEMRRQIIAARKAGEGFGPDDDFDPDGPMDDGNPMGLPEDELTMMVDVGEFVLAKRGAIGAHRSQVTDSSFFMQMPDEAFALAFGREWFREHGVEPGPRPGWFFES